MTDLTREEIEGALGYDEESMKELCSSHTDWFREIYRLALRGLDDKGAEERNLDCIERQALKIRVLEARVKELEGENSGLRDKVMDAVERGRRWEVKARSFEDEILRKEAE
jgi:hypothetical protein